MTKADSLDPAKHCVCGRRDTGKKYSFSIALVALLVLLVALVMFITYLQTRGVTYPHLEYQNSANSYDRENRTIFLKQGYILNDSNPYDIEETEDGFNVIIHMVKE